jgi:hypothetical protein
MYETTGVTKDNFLEAWESIIEIDPNRGLGYRDRNNMLTFVRKVQAELDLCTGTSKETPDLSVAGLIGLQQAKTFVKDNGGYVSPATLTRGFAEAWAIGLAFGMLFEREQAAKDKGVSELSNLLTWEKELESEFECGRHLTILPIERS